MSKLRNLQSIYQNLVFILNSQVCQFYPCFVKEITEYTAIMGEMISPMKIVAIFSTIPQN